MTKLDLAPESMPAGLMERLFLHETISPAYPDYDRDSSLRAMRMMRQVIENRLRSPKDWGAPMAKDEIGVITVRSQFGRFADYPNIPQAFLAAVYAMVRLANTSKDPRSAANRQHVQDAIAAATETSPPVEFSNPRLLAWRTAGASAPGARFRLFATVQRNSFYVVP